MMEPLPSRRADLDTPDTRELRKLIEEVGHKLKDPTDAVKLRGAAAAGEVPKLMENESFLFQIFHIFVQSTIMEHHRFYHIYLHIFQSIDGLWLIC